MDLQDKIIETIDTRDKVIKVIDALFNASNNLISVYMDTCNNFYLELSEKIYLLNKTLIEEQKDEINQAK